MKILASGLLGFLSALAISSPGSAQAPGEMTLFSGPGFTGARYTVTGQRNILTIPFRVRSVLIARGEPWQLCTRTQLRGCTTYRSSVRSISLQVRSARPVTAVAPSPGQHGPSFRGVTTELFVRPEINGRRVAARGTAAGAQSSANDFCRRVGWTRSAYQRLETIGGRVYLMDVLCVRSMA